MAFRSRSFNRPDGGFIFVHPLHKFAARRCPALDSFQQNQAFYLAVAPIGDVVTEPTSSSRTAPT